MNIFLQLTIKMHIPFIMRVEPCKLITPISIRFVVPRRLCYNIALYNVNTII